MMQDILLNSAGFPAAMVWINAMILGASAVFTLAAAPLAVRVFARQAIATSTSVSLGVLQLAAAVLLLDPELRMWGIVLAAVIAFGAVVLLLDRGRYASALPVAGFMLALAVSAASVPAHRSHIHYLAGTGEVSVSQPGPSGTVPRVQGDA